MSIAANLRLPQDGAELHTGAATQALPIIEDALASLPANQAGLRLRGVDGLAPLLAPTGPIGLVASRVLGEACQAVRAVLFDKSEASNWSLPWHQDRTIAVLERKHVGGFGPWTIKDGMHHVEPPTFLLAGMITLRVHLDPVPLTNAPLLVALGSHRIGRIPHADIASVVERCTTIACIAEAGDVWAYSTPIVHASEAAQMPTRRRVLQVDYTSAELLGGLQWLGI